MTAFVLTLSCPDRIGIVAEVGVFLRDHGCNIVESAQFGDPDNGMFFMRVRFQAEKRDTGADDLEGRFEPVAAGIGADASIHNERTRPRVLILVSRFGHCLNDLLFRWRTGALPMDIPAVVSNHADLETLVESYGLPFVHLPVTPDSRQRQEDQILALIAKENVDLVVLARYMQVLSPSVREALPGRVINIHHSFLPSFKGAKPYHQAHDMGVKLIGASAHYVTEDLDEGPIIEQDVARVGHTQSIDDLVGIGRDIECVVLARAVKWHLEHRVMLNGRRTVVFN